MEFQELISAIQEDFFQINRESKDMKELKDLYVGFAESHKQNFKTLQFHLKSKTWILGEKLTILDFKLASLIQILSQFEMAANYSGLMTQPAIINYLERFNALEEIQKFRQELESEVSLEYYDKNCTWRGIGL